MTRRSLLDSLSLLAVAGAAPRFALGQGSAQRKSPHETVSLEVGGKQISITYGRPSLKGRTAFAAGELAPSGQVWRLGADEATKLVLTGAAMLNGTLATPAGSYALFAIPGDSQWTVIVNKTADQWGAFNYDKAQDLGRFPCPVRKAGHTEEFTIALANTSGKGATVSMAWQDAQVSFPIQFR